MKVRLPDLSAEFLISEGTREVCGLHLAEENTRVIGAVE